MVAVGESHRVASPSTYCHLLGEAHCVLASARLLCAHPELPSPSPPQDHEEALQVRAVTFDLAIVTLSWNQPAC